MTTTEPEIEAIARRMIACTLPKPEWTHRAHFAAALWLLDHPDELAWHGGMAVLIRRYNLATGVANSETSGYHETITLASLSGAAALRAAHPELALAAVLDALMGGPLGDKDWLRAYWSRELLMSPDARARWVEPDLVALPWPRINHYGMVA